MSVEILAYCCTSNANRWDRGALSATVTFYSAICIVLYTYRCTRHNYRTASMQCRACYQQTSVPPVNWTVTMINQRRLPPMLLTSPHITPPVHHHGRKPPRGWTQGFQTAEVTSKVTKGHPYWCHSIGHVRFPISLQLQLCVYLAPFPRYYHLFPKVYRGHVTLNASVLAVIYHACTSTVTPVYQPAHEILTA